MLGVLLGTLFTFAFGGLLLILFLGARKIEDELDVQAREMRQIREQAARIPRFFVVTHPAGPQTGPMDEKLLWQLRQYVDAEQVLADEFVLQPSVESLYRDSGRLPIGH